MYSVYLFDFDYTLGDSTQAIVSSVNHALLGMGHAQRSTDEIRYTIGMSLPEAFTYLTKDEDELQRQQFKKLFMEKADQVMTAGTSLFPDTVGLLTFLKASGKKTGIVTTKFHRRIEAILYKFDIDSLVDVIVGGDDVTNNKPHPEALLLAIDKLNAKPADVLYIGDSLIDGMTAMGAGVDFIAVTTGTTTKEEFSNYPSVAILKSLSELPLDGQAGV